MNCLAAAVAKVAADISRTCAGSDYESTVRTALSMCSASDEAAT